MDNNFLRGFPSRHTRTLNSLQRTLRSTPYPYACKYAVRFAHTCEQGLQNLKTIPGNKNITFWCTSLTGVSAGLGWAWLLLDSGVGKGGSGQAGNCHQALNILIQLYIMSSAECNQIISQTLNPNSKPRDGG